MAATIRCEEELVDFNWRVRRVHVYEGVDVYKLQVVSACRKLACVKLRDSCVWLCMFTPDLPTRKHANTLAPIAGLRHARQHV